MPTARGPLCVHDRSLLRDLPQRALQLFHVGQVRTRANTDRLEMPVLRRRQCADDRAVRLRPAAPDTGDLLSDDGRLEAALADNEALMRALTDARRLLDSHSEIFEKLWKENKELRDQNWRLALELRRAARTA